MGLLLGPAEDPRFPPWQLRAVLAGTVTAVWTSSWWGFGDQYGGSGETIESLSTTLLAAALACGGVVLLIVATTRGAVRAAAWWFIAPLLISAVPGGLAARAIFDEDASSVGSGFGASLALLVVVPLLLWALIAATLVAYNDHPESDDEPPRVPR